MFIQQYFKKITVIQKLCKPQIEMGKKQKSSMLKELLVTHEKPKTNATQNAVRLTECEYAHANIYTTLY